MSNKKESKGLDFWSVVAIAAVSTVVGGVVTRIMDKQLDKVLPPPPPKA